MFQVQKIDIITFIIMVLVLVASIILKYYLKKRLRDIEGDSEIYKRGKQGEQRIPMKVEGR